MDCIDAWLPASAIGIVNFNDGILGICGYVSERLCIPFKNQTPPSQNDYLLHGATESMGRVVRIKEVTINPLFILLRHIYAYTSLKWKLTNVLPQEGGNGRARIHLDEFM
jgi:hypothetical protein